MKLLSSLGIGLSLVSGFLLLALVAELYYLLWWKKRIPNRGIVADDKYYTLFFCWKKPSSLSSTALNPQQISSELGSTDAQHSKDVSLIPLGDEEMEAELMRLHNLSGPPRFLFTIKEETKEDLESEDGNGRSRKSSRGRSLSNVMLNVDSSCTTTPFMTPLSSPPFLTPPLTPLDCDNPLFESLRTTSTSSGSSCANEAVKASPPPQLKFLRDAEEKLYRKTLKEEALKLHKINGGNSLAKGKEEEDGSFITIIIGKNQHQPSSSQVNPLPSPSTVVRPKHGKLISYLSSSD